MIQKRRTLLGLLSCSIAVSVSYPSFSTRLLTPSQMLGPFYPDNLPLDHDNDLTKITGHDGVAMGTITHLLGHVLNSLGQPIIDAQVEIWQCDSLGQYKHESDGGGLDPAFQGYGRTKSGKNGEYRFKTIRPVAYPGRTPHIHMRIVSRSTKLATQIYVKGEPLNHHDFILNSIRDTKSRDLLIIPFVSEAEYPSNELVARFNPVISE